MFCGPETADVSRGEAEVSLVLHKSFAFSLPAKAAKLLILDES